MSFLGQYESNDRKGGLSAKFKTKALIIAALTILIIAIQIWFGMKFSSRMVKIEQQWQEYNEYITSEASTLARIQGHFGYGGFVHHFKNYILRKDPALLPILKTDIQSTLELLNNYPTHSKESDESKAISTIRKVIITYAHKVDIAEQMIAEGKSSNAIDNEIIVNDQPAFAAFKQLNKHYKEENHEHNVKTTRALNRTLDFLVLGFTLIPGITLFIGGILILFLRYTVHTSKQLQSTSQYLNDLFNAAPDTMLIINGKGLIADANEQAIDLFGYSYDDLIGMNIGSLIPERYRGQHEKYISPSFKTSKKSPLRSGENFKVLVKDGSETPVEISINYTLRGEEKHAITILRDVTNREITEQVLRDKEKMLNNAQQVAHVGSWDWNLKKDSFIWSDEMHHIFNLGPDEFGANYDAFVERLHPLDREEVVNAVNAAIILDQPLDLEHRIIRADGLERIVHLRGEVYRDKEGKGDHLVGTIHDITEVKYTENELRLADNVFNHTLEAILVTDADSQILRVNKAFTTITGYSAKEAIGQNPGALMNSGKHDKEFYKEFWKKLNTHGIWEGEIWERRKDGKIFPCWHNISAVKDDHGNLIQYISIFNDITDKKIAEEHIEHLAQYDQLTKLPNRILFNDRLQQAFIHGNRSNDKTGLMFIDLDRFKSVNDTLGHQAGDQLLQEVARRLTDCVRQVDTVARLGGDEFTIILEQLKHAEDSAIVADKILKALSQKVKLGKHEVTIGGSIGISIHPDDGTDTESIIKNADMAMYQAKHLGKNQYHFYTDELANLADTRFHTENRLRNAFDSGELELYYQPQINILNGKLIGAEALIRWNDPDRGIIPPDNFIPLAEEMGMINDIGKWVLENACTQAKQWQEQGYPPIRISVNLSGCQIKQGSIVEIVARILKKTKLQPEYLELEILENFVMERPDQGILTIKALRYLGVSLAIDDFGTGYSSLSYLKQLDIDRLKIDRSFVMEIPHNKDDKAIVSTIISMARNLGLSVIAEGVESEDHIKFLSDNNCIEMQGFYFSRPVPCKDFIPFFNKTYPTLALIKERENLINK